MVMLLGINDKWKDLIKDKKWIGELKRDGNCLIIQKTKDGFEFFNRNMETYTKEMPKEILDHLDLFKYSDTIKTFTFHGELVYVDKDGKDHRTQAQSEGSVPHYVVFDMIEYNGEDFTQYDWKTRKHELREIFSDYATSVMERPLEDYPISLIEQGQLINMAIHTFEKQKLYDMAKEHGHEGIVLKHVDGKYIDGRSKECIKVKFTDNDDAIVIGYTDASEFSINSKGEQINNKRFPYFKALVLAKFNKDGTMKAKGMIGGGFKDVNLPVVTELLNKNKYKITLDDLSAPQTFTGTHSFIDKDYGLPKNRINWLDKDDWFTIEVKCSQLTEKGVYFQGRFVTIRDDKQPKECIE